MSHVPTRCQHTAIDGATRDSMRTQKDFWGEKQRLHGAVAGARTRMTMRAWRMPALAPRGRIDAVLVLWDDKLPAGTIA